MRLTVVQLIKQYVFGKLDYKLTKFIQSVNVLQCHSERKITSLHFCTTAILLSVCV